MLLFPHFPIFKRLFVYKFDGRYIQFLDIRNRTITETDVLLFGLSYGSNVKHNIT